MKIGDKVKFRSTTLEMKRLWDCSVEEKRATRIFNGEIGEIVDIRKNGNWSPLDIKIRFSTFHEEYDIPANYFVTVTETKKGHHLTSMFEPDLKKAY